MARIVSIFQFTGRVGSVVGSKGKGGKVLFRHQDLLQGIEQRRGYEVYVTHRSGDKGVDVVAVKGEDYYAIQCKHSKKNIGQECMSEVLAGAKYYEAIYGKKLTPLSWTNSYYSPTAIDFAQNIGVKSFDRSDLTRWIQDCSVSLKDVYKLDNTRS